MFRPARIFFAVLTGILLQAPSPVHAKPRGVCPDAEALTVNTTFRRPGTAPGARGCYRVTLASPGILALDVSDLGRRETEPRLAFLGTDPLDGPRSGAFRVVQQTPRETIVQVEAPGSFLLSVASEDPTRPLDGYKLRNTFVSEDTLSGNQPVCPPTKDVEKKDCDPIELSALELGIRLLALCDAAWEDDHGDTPLCATPLRPGESVSGRIDRGEGDDEDFFTFALDELRTVEVAVLGEAAAYQVTLYGGDGLRLDVTETARLVKTLPPGRYHLRLLRPPFDPSAGDAYVLTLRILDEYHG